MQITSPEPEKQEIPTETPSQSEIQEVSVSPASIEMLCKLFPNKKRAVLELVLKRCNHDLLKAIEHFNMSNAKVDLEDEKKVEPNSAFKPVHSKIKSINPTTHTSAIPLLAGNKVFMHSLYPFLPLFNPQPVMPSPVYVPGFCECEQCKHSLYARIESRPQL